MRVPRLNKPPKGVLQLSYIDKALFRRYKDKYKEVIDIQVELSSVVNLYMEERLRPSRLGDTSIMERIEKEGAELCTD